MKADIRGVAALTLSVLLCAAAHVILRWAAGGGGELLELATRPGVWLGLAVYGCGTGLWILCLRRLDLSFAFPASAVQLLLVYAGAALLLGESIPPLRLLGAAVILFGIGLLFLERRSRA
jgi:drug/metabolite transporter (DMT)-like permease